MLFWNKKKKSPIAVIDIGSHKMACVIALPQSSGEVEVLGASVRASDGVRAGAVIDITRAERALLLCVQEAERVAGVRIQEGWLTLSAGHLRSFSYSAEIPLKGRQVTEADLWAVLEKVRKQHLQRETQENERLLIHTIPVSYSLDGYRKIKDPRGLRGHKFGIEAHFITASTGVVENLLTCARRCQVEVAGLVASPFASGIAVLSEEEKELGTLVIDFGAGVTAASIFSGGVPIFVTTVPLGGQSITQDIAICLSTSRAEGERLKTLEGHAIPLDDGNDPILEAMPLGGQEPRQRQSIRRSYMHDIMHTRLRETLELLRQGISDGGFADRRGYHTVITGGGAGLPGLQDLVANILDGEVRVGQVGSFPGLPESFSSSRVAAVLGALQYALEEREADFSPPQRSQNLSLGKWLEAHFWSRA